MKDFAFQMMDFAFQMIKNRAARDRVRRKLAAHREAGRDLRHFQRVWRCDARAYEQGLRARRFQGRGRRAECRSCLPGMYLKC